jgi:hydroxyacylglutathione hydrolase
MSAGEVEELVNQNKEITVLDVRNEDEYLSQHLDLVNLQHIPLDQLNQRMEEVQDHEKVYVHCAGGYRSPIAMSMLKARGVHNVVNIKGGLAALNETTLNKSKYVCPSSLL